MVYSRVKIERNSKSDRVSFMELNEPGGGYNL